MADTLQEFLVSLKYQQDEASQRRLLDGVKTTESKIGSFAKTSLKAAAALGAMGVIAAKGTLDYAKGVEQLNFVAKRTNTSLASLIALQKAAASFGSSAGGAQGSLEGIASFMRNNPGSAAFLSSIGVKEKDANGKQRDTVAIMSDLATRFKEMPVWRANQYAQMLGIDENTMLAMRSKGFDSSLDKYRSVIGNKANAAGSASHDLMNQDRLLGTSIFAEKADGMTSAMGLLTDALKKANGTIEENNNAVSWLVKLYSMNSGLGDPAGKAAAAAAGLWAAKRLGLIGAGSAAEAGAITAGGIGAGAISVGAASLLFPSSTQSDEQEQSELKKYRGQYKDLLHGRREMVVSRLMANGLTRDQAIAMAASFQQESTVNGLPFNPRASNAGHLGIAQWDKNRQALFAKHMGFPVQAAGLNDQLDFAAWEIKHRPEWKKMQANPHNLARLNEIVTRDYESPGNYGTEIPKRMGIAQNINTTINVRSTDPKLTAHEVEKAQTKVNQQLSRNTVGAIR